MKEMNALKQKNQFDRLIDKLARPFQTSLRGSVRISIFEY